MFFFTLIFHIIFLKTVKMNIVNVFRWVVHCNRHYAPPPQNVRSPVLKSKCFLKFWNLKGRLHSIIRLPFIQLKTLWVLKYWAVFLFFYRLYRHCFFFLLIRFKSWKLTFFVSDKLLYCCLKSWIVAEFLFKFKLFNPTVTRYDPLLK